MLLLRVCCEVSVIRFVALQLTDTNTNTAERALGLVLGQGHARWLALVMGCEIGLAALGTPTLHRWTLADVLQHHVSTLAMLLCAEAASRACAPSTYVDSWWNISTVTALWLVTSTGVEILRTAQKLAHDAGAARAAARCDIAALALSLVDMCVTGPLCSPVLGVTAWRSGEWPIGLLFVLASGFMLALYPAWVRSIARSLWRKVGVGQVSMGKELGSGRRKSDVRCRSRGYVVRGGGGGWT